MGTENGHPRDWRDFQLLHRPVWFVQMPVATFSLAYCSPLQPVLIMCSSQMKQVAFCWCLGHLPSGQERERLGHQHPQVFSGVDKEYDSCSTCSTGRGALKTYGWEICKTFVSVPKWSHTGTIFISVRYHRASQRKGECRWPWCSCLGNGGWLNKGQGASPHWTKGSAGDFKGAWEQRGQHQR